MRRQPSPPAPLPPGLAAPGPPVVPAVPAALARAQTAPRSAECVVSKRSYWSRHQYLAVIPTRGWILESPTPGAARMEHNVCLSHRVYEVRSSVSSRKIIASLLLHIFLLAGIRLCAQTPGTGTIAGRVFDPSRGVIPG